MATIGEAINSGLCALQNVLGSEISKGCVTQIKAAKSIWAIAPGEKFNVGETFESEKDRLIKAGKLLIFRGVNTFEENGSEDASETLADDTQLITNEGKYKFTATFTNGLFFNAALHSIKGFRNWNILLVDGTGIYGTKTTNGSLTGFTTGMIQPAKLAIGTNAAAQKEGLQFQFLEREELDKDYAFIADSTLRKQKGVTQINLSYVNAPSDGDTTLTVKATLAQDGSVAFGGSTFSDFLFTVGGTTSNPTAGDDSAKTGTYVLTVPSLSTGNEVALKLFKENASVIVGPDGDYYKSNLLTTTVVA
ncbi:hypothetical protein QO206_13305 [Leeuwenhoekiella aequorea]|uniref:hypothetical protein n=1 Tax=Leeuwenhoekiella aequorea TaxID=283736 RepID=UPI00352BE5EA|tara:strand:+ start:20956 stop:21873 length:918 start_codon:yes stop_codon:yes gene_type:complete